MNTPPTNELSGPQTSVWHFGWNTPNSRDYNANFRKMGLTIAQMWNGSDADAKLVDLSGDVPTLPGGGFPTQEQVLELREKGAKVDPSVTAGGFGYLRGPDGVMIENAENNRQCHQAKIPGIHGGLLWQSLYRQESSMSRVTR